VGAEGASLEFTEEGIKEVARIATQLNERMENIGARRLQTVLTTVLEDILFRLPEEGLDRVVADLTFVQERLKEIMEDEDLQKYIL
jgi:ATP-dependent HslUV protease ATP-binding subunit HslU